MTTVIAFDVNETLLDLRALDAHFEALFGTAALRAQWFAQMLQLAFVGGLTGDYVDFTAAQRAALTMLGERNGIALDQAMVAEVVDGMRTLPPHPEVAEALDARRHPLAARGAYQFHRGGRRRAAHQRWPPPPVRGRAVSRHSAGTQARGGRLPARRHAVLRRAL